MMDASVGSERAVIERYRFPRRRGPDDRSISCLMVTQDRYPLSWLAVVAFCRQTYPDRELVIVDKGTDLRLAAAVAALGNPSVRLIRPRSRKISLGAMRNLAVKHARGRYVCTWDDDDLYDAERLELQMQVLLNARVPVCMLQAWLAWWPEEKRLAVLADIPLMPSLLCEKELMAPFPPLPRAEDTPVIEDLLARFKPGLAFLPQLYVYVYHGRNTWATEQFDGFWAHAKKRLVGYSYDAAIAKLSERLAIDEYQGLLRDWRLTQPAPPTGERARMLAGEPFQPDDAALTEDRVRAEDLQLRYNATKASERIERWTMLQELLGEIGEGSVIRPRFSCDYGYNIRIGQSTFVNCDCVFLDCAPIEIGHHVQIGPAVQLYAGGHPVERRLEGTAAIAGKPIRIGHQVWIGGGAVVLPGVSIGDGSVVGAGSVVVDDVLANTLVAGNPARLVRKLA